MMKYRIVNESGRITLSSARPILWVKGCTFDVDTARWCRVYENTQDAPLLFHHMSNPMFIDSTSPHPFIEGGMVRVRDATEYPCRLSLHRRHATGCRSWFHLLQFRQNFHDESDFTMVVEFDPRTVTYKFATDPRDDVRVWITVDPSNRVTQLEASAPMPGLDSWATNPSDWHAYFKDGDSEPQWLQELMSMVFTRTIDGESLTDNEVWDTIYKVVTLTYPDGSRKFTLSTDSILFADFMAEWGDWV